MEIVVISMKERCVVCVEVPSDQKSSWTHPLELLGECVMWNLVLVRLETMLVSVQYRCTVCVERTIGSKIILDTPYGTPR
jgi:hypothetical protein